MWLHPLLPAVVFPLLGGHAFSGRGSWSLNSSLILAASLLKGFNESGDPSCMIMQNWARIEVSVFDRCASDMHL